jgi:hypothetical protein
MEFPLSYMPTPLTNPNFRILKEDYQRYLHNFILAFLSYFFVVEVEMSCFKNLKMAKRTTLAV